MRFLLLTVSDGMPTVFLRSSWQTGLPYLSGYDTVHCVCRHHDHHRHLLHLLMCSPEVMELLGVVQSSREARIVEIAYLS